MTAKEILDEIRPLGASGYRKILLNHGAAEPCFGVKIDELKKIQKRIKTNHRLALELYDTGVYDARYLAGLIADDALMTVADLQRWAETACEPLAGSTVAWVAAGSPHGLEVARAWIESTNAIVAAAGWATSSSLVAIRDDAQLDLAQLRVFLERVRRTIHREPDEVRSKMNGFVIAAGTHVRTLTDFAVEIGEAVGPVTVDAGKTACRVPFAPDHIRKAVARGVIGKKRKTAKC